MTDPDRLSKDSTNPLAALLLQAGRREKPSSAARSRTAQAVAAASVAVATAALVKSAGSASAATVGTSGSAAGTIGVAAVAKWIAIGALGGAVAMSSLQALSADHGTERARATAALITNAAVSKPSQRWTKAPATALDPVASAQPMPAERANAVEAQATRRAEPASAAPAAPERTGSAFLAAEVRFVDRGRDALQRGAFAEAIEQLAPYERLFPQQQLLTEVLFLRMESDYGLGNGDRARAFAARILSLGVVGRQAAQARELLGNSEKSKSAVDLLISRPASPD